MSLRGGAGDLTGAFARGCRDEEFVGQVPGQWQARLKQRQYTAAGAFRKATRGGSGSSDRVSAWIGRVCGCRCCASRPSVGKSRSTRVGAGRS